MTSSAPRPVVSGKPYPISLVNDHPPRALAEFAGQTVFVLVLAGDDDYTVFGSGLSTDDGVQVFEKDAQGAGRDIRVWVVRQDGAGAFTAEHCGPWRRSG